MTASAAPLRRVVSAAPTLQRRGRLVWAFAGIVKATGLDVRVGQSCDIVDPTEGARIPAEVIGFAGDAAVLTSLRPLYGLSNAAEVVPGPSNAVIAAGNGLLGRVIDAGGAPQDGKGPIVGDLTAQPVYADAPLPFERAAIDRVFATGVRAVDALFTLGVGQRLGIFATAGGGKSTLLGMIARQCESDLNVIGLVGERGREVQEFVQHALGAAGLARSVVVVATSDRPAIERVRAANAATALAEAFRARGKRVVLMMDSVTRYARALREVGLSMGEPSVRRGFPPSVFAELPRLFERAGAVGSGSVTAIYTVLLEEQEEGADPIGEETRSILDGHIYLSRKLGEAGRYPAIDVAASASRLFGLLAGAEQRAGAARLRALLTKFAEIEFLIQIGEYKPGGDALADEAVRRMPQIEAFLRQAQDERTSYQDSLEQLRAVLA